MGEGRATNAMLLLGRLLLAACFVPAAFGHATNISGLAFSLSQKGLPSADVLAALIVLAEVFGPLALLLGVAPRLAPAALILAALVTTVTLHRFWEFGPALRPLEQATFTAQIAIVAGLVLAIVAGPGAWSLQAWWRGAGAPAKPKAKKKPSRPRVPKAKPAARPAADQDEEWADAA